MENKETIKKGGYSCHECAKKNNGTFHGGTKIREHCIVCDKESIQAPTTDYSWPWHKQTFGEWD
jgi:hypothetical protein